MFVLKYMSIEDQANQMLDYKDECMYILELKELLKQREQECKFCF